MKRTKTEEHHVTPICMVGDDFKENIITLTVSDHKMIHATLDIPYYKLRRFRKATNHMINRNSQQFVSRLRNLHLEYFKNHEKLPIKLQNLQRDSVRDTTRRIIQTYNISIKMPKENADIFAWLKCYHNSLIYR
jgi:methyl coenzyme M reductase subunit C-like uncharacterized protein (methanogenesis marker protein 7)